MYICHGCRILNSGKIVSLTILSLGTLFFLLVCLVRSQYESLCSVLLYLFRPVWFVHWRPPLFSREWMMSGSGIERWLRRDRRMDGGKPELGMYCMREEAVINKNLSIHQRFKGHVHLIQYSFIFFIFMLCNFLPSASFLDLFHLDMHIYNAV